MKSKIIIASVIIVFLSILTIWDNNRIVNTSYAIESDKIRKPLKIIQVSDFHNSSLGNKILNAVKKESPDIIAVTGDLIDSSKPDIETSLSLIQNLLEIAPVYYVTGNHESWLDDYELTKQQMQDMGVYILSGMSVEIGNNVTICGIDDPDFMKEFGADSTAIIEEQLKDVEIDTDDYNILLSHRPEAINEYADKQFDLALTGHAHGGQFRIPFIGGLIAPDQGWFPKYDAGSYIKDETMMIVSRGIGNSIIPVRINNPPEIISVSIIPK